MSKPKNRGISVLIVDDEELLVKSCGQILSSEGFIVFTEGRCRNALEFFRRESPDIVLTDLNLPDGDGLALLKQMKRERPETLVIMITGFATVGSSVEAIRAGAYDYVPKPFTATQLRILVGRAAEHIRQGRRLIPMVRENSLLLREVELLKDEIRRLEGRQTASEPPEIYRVILLSVLHDLRNVFDSISISAELLRTGEVPDEMLAKTYEVMHGAAQRAVELMQRLHSTLEGDRGFAELVDANALVRKVAREGKLQLPSGVRLVISRHLREPAMVSANPHYLALVIRELIRNAAHVLSEGGGTIRVEVEKDLDQVCILVRDTGPGLPSPVLAKLERVRSREDRNLGSGLPLSLRLLQAMDGSLHVADSTPAGSTLVVTLPARLG